MSEVKDKAPKKDKIERVNKTLHSSPATGGKIVECQVNKPDNGEK